ncbi:MAG: stage V sporulation protein SpoVM [Kyrpidia sp.]|nr:stage V sporulation protein SpoVM [Kyrpidia sp.]
MFWWPGRPSSGRPTEKKRWPISSGRLHTFRPSRNIHKEQWEQAGARTAASRDGARIPVVEEGFFVRFYTIKLPRFLGEIVKAILNAFQKD